ncbi:MAG: phage tail tape measure protein, partial [Clostridiales bacterium]|nr:phage tail tape measure protein [Clostridiales bacterium]
MGKISTLLTLDGDSEFKRKLRDINERLTTLGKQEKSLTSDLVDHSMKMQQAAKIMANFGTQLDLLRTKHGLLSQALRNAEAELDKSRSKYAEMQERFANLPNVAKQITVVRNALETAKRVYGENSGEVRNLTNKLKALVEEQNTVPKALAQAQKELDKNAIAVLKYKQQLADTETQMHRTESEQKKLTESLRQGGTEMQKFSSANVVNAFKTIGSSLGTAASTTAKLTVEAGKLAATFARAEFKAFETTMQGIAYELQLGTEGVKAYTEQFAKAATAVAKFAATNGMTFEESMSKVQAYSGASAEDMERLTAAAKEMGATTSKTAAQSADALGYLALNGYKTEEMLNTLKPVVKAAEAGSMDLATTANQTARALKAYGKETEDAEEFLNVVTATQNNSATSMEQLLNAYVDLAGTFKQLNVGYYESATLLGQMANQGIAGTEAGTALNSVMLRLLETNKNSAEAFDVMGLSAWDANGKFRGLTTILAELNEKMNDMTEQERTMKAKDIFGVRMYAQGLKFIQSVADQEGYSELYDAVSNASANNVLYNTAEIMLDNLKGRLTLLKSAAEALGISLFETFSPEVTSRVERFTDFVNTLNEGVQNGFPGMEAAIEKVGQGLKGMLLVSIEQTAQQLPQTLSVYNKVIVTAADLLISGIRKSKNRIIPSLITGAKDLVISLIKRLPEFTREFTDGAVIFYSCLIDAMKETATELTKVLPDVINTLVNAITENAPALLEGGFEILMILGNGIIDNLPTILNCAVEIINKLIDGISEHIDEILEGAETIIEGLADAIVKVINADNVVKLLEIGGKIIDKICEILVKDEVLAKFGGAAIDVVNGLSHWLVTNSGPIFEEKVPEMIDKLIEQFTSPENKAAMYEAGENLGGALLIGLGHMLKGIIKLYIKEYERSIAMW